MFQVTTRSLVALFIVLGPNVSLASIVNNYTLSGVDGELGLAFSSDGKWLVAGSSAEHKGDLSPRLFALESGKPPTLRYVLNDTQWPQFPDDPLWWRDSSSGSLVFSEDSKWLVASKVVGKGTVEALLYTVQVDGPPMLHVTLGPYTISNPHCSMEMEFSPDSKWLLVGIAKPGEDEERVHSVWELYSLEDGQPPTLQARSTGWHDEDNAKYWLVPPVFSKDSKWLAANYALVGGMELYSLDVGNATLQLSCDDCFVSYVFSADSKWLACQTGDLGDDFRLYSLNAGHRPKEAFNLPDHRFDSLGNAFSSDSTYLILSPADIFDKLKFYALDLKAPEYKSPALRFVLKGDEIAFSGDSQWAAIGRLYDNSLSIYALGASIKPELKFLLNNSYDRSYDNNRLKFGFFGFSADCKWLASKGHVYTFKPNNLPIREFSLIPSNAGGNYMMFSGSSKWLGSVSEVPAHTTPPYNWSGVVQIYELEIGMPTVII